jgi:hypothetical protein
MAEKSYSLAEWQAGERCLALRTVETIAGFEIHPIASCWPIILEEKMVDDIYAHGIKTPIIVDQDGRVIDGRTRLKIHEKLMSEEAPDDPLGYPYRFGNASIPFEKKTLSVELVSIQVERANDMRRHLSDAQRSLAILKQEAIVEAYDRRFDKPAPSTLVELEAAESKAKAQFKAGNKASPNGRAGKAKETVNLNSDSPFPERDIKEMNANSAIGLLAAKAKVSRHTANQILKINKGPEPIREAVFNGQLKAPEAVQILKNSELIKQVAEKEITPAEAVEMIPKTPKKDPALVRHINKVTEWIEKHATMKDLAEIQARVNQALGDNASEPTALAPNLERVQAWLESNAKQDEIRQVRNLANKELSINCDCDKAKKEKKNVG